LRDNRKPKRASGPPPIILSPGPMRSCHVYSWLVSLRQFMNSIDKGIHYLDYICTEKSFNMISEKDFAFLQQVQLPFDISTFFLQTSAMDKPSKGSKRRKLCLLKRTWSPN
jgi:hypothetical protein